MKQIKEKQSGAFESLKGAFGYTNALETPRIVKVIVSAGTGSIKNKKKVDLIGDRLIKITGQKPAPRLAKQSIASFKLRQGEPIGYQVTLRGKRMNDFLDRLINIALPRMRDFRGISAKAIDTMGNYTLGIREHTIFPETGDEEVKDLFGMAVTIVTTSKNKEETKALLAHLGFPFKTIETSDEPQEKKKKPVKKKKKEKQEG